MIKQEIWLARTADVAEKLVRLQLLFCHNEEGITLSSALLLDEVRYRLKNSNVGLDPVLAELLELAIPDRGLVTPLLVKFDKPLSALVADLAEATAIHLRAYMSVDGAAAAYGCTLEVLEGIRWCLDLSGISQPPVLSVFVDECFASERFEGGEPDYLVEFLAAI